MNFFIDNHLSHRLADALNALSDIDDTVVHVARKFGPSASDQVWIAELGEEGGWVVICGDWRIRTKPAERRLFAAAGLTTFFLAKGWTNTLDYWRQAHLLVRWWPKISQQAKLVEPGTLFSVPISQSGVFKSIPPT